MKWRGRSRVSAKSTFLKSTHNFFNNRVLKYRRGDKSSLTATSRKLFSAWKFIWRKTFSFLKLCCLLFLVFCEEKDSSPNCAIDVYKKLCSLSFPSSRSPVLPLFLVLLSNFFYIRIHNNSRKNVPSIHHSELAQVKIEHRKISEIN